MQKFLQDLQHEFDKGQADASQAVRSGRLSMNNALRISLSAYWPAAAATLVGLVVLRRLMHWSLWTSLGGGLALGVVVLLVVTRWINRTLDQTPAPAPQVLDKAL